MSIHVMQTVWRHSKQRGNALMLLLALADNANDAGMAWPSVATLAKKARMSERSVQGLVQRLVAGGELRVEPGGGRGYPNRYAITVQELRPLFDEMGASPAPIPAERVQIRAERVQISAGKGAKTRRPEAAVSSLGLRTRGRAGYEPSREPSREPSKGGAAPGAPAPAPPGARGNPKVAAVVDALRAAGMRGTVTPRDARAIREVEHEPREVAALYAAIFRGEYGDAFMRDNLSVALCLEKLPGWRSHRAGHTAPPRANGPPSGQAYLMEQLRLARLGAGGEEEREHGPRGLPGRPVQAGHHARPGR